MNKTADTHHENYQRLSEQPLVHPGVFAHECFDFDSSIPPHLARIYEDFYESVDPYFSSPKRLCYILPREHGKSVAGTAVCPAWYALNDPNARILIMSETTSQARRKLSETKSHINRLADQFGQEVKYDNRSSITLERSEASDVPTILAAGYDSGVTGGHFDVIIFDDVVSWSTQRTESRREKSWTKFLDYQNLGAGGETTYVVLGTRKHEEDLYHHLVNGPAWKTIVEPAISDWSVVENREFSVTTDAGNRYPGVAFSEIPAGETVPDASHIHPHRNVDVLWQDRWPLNKLLYDLISGFGANEGTAVWRRERQNDPKAMSGKILSKSMLNYTDRLPEDPGKCVWVAGVDPAITEDPEEAVTGNTDWWACAVLAHSPKFNQTVVVDVQRQRGMSIDAGIDWVKSVVSGYPVSDVLAETVQAQHWLVQVAKNKGMPMRATTSSGNKRRRLISMSGKFESGEVKLLEKGPNVDDYGKHDWEGFEHEWLNFPSGHDDQLDSVELALRGVDTSSIQRVPSTW